MTVLLVELKFACVHALKPSLLHVSKQRKKYEYTFVMSKILQLTRGRDYENSAYRLAFFLLEGIPQDLCTKHQRYIYITHTLIKCKKNHNSLQQRLIRKT